MLEVTIYGRGGQGGVTLAKLIATAYFLRGKHVQAFGVYAAERSGAPLQAFVRIDDREITNHNQVREPNYVIVLDRTLIGPRILTGLKPDGAILLNSGQAPSEFGAAFSGRRLAVLDATAIALENELGTRTVPIVNTALLGAAARLLDLSLNDVEAALAEVKFGGSNVDAARSAYEQVQIETLAGKPEAVSAAVAKGPVAGLFDDVVGERPAIQTGTWATRQPQRRRLTPPCNNACPAGNDIQAFVQAVSKKDHDAALEILLETSPFPGVCGRVCPAPCMDVCNRSEHDEPVNIRELERYSAEHGRLPAITRIEQDRPVAVIGSGPAGLSAAYHLARLGYAVTIIERDHELGGVMRSGIPTYRLPRDVLDEEISYILRHGIKTKTDHGVDRAELLNLTHEFEAVFIATGLQELRALNLGQVPAQVAMQGIDFLDHARRGRETTRGQRVIVVGGGNTAIDAARSARRLGAKTVHIVYRRTRAEMPAIDEEIEHALEEGVLLDELVMPLRLQQNGMESVLTCTRMKLGEPDESGRPRPVPETSEDALFDLTCDRVILALGQSQDLSILPEGAEVRHDEALLGLTGAPVFSGGDFATNNGTVSAAIGSGRKAAWHIHRTLTDEDLFPPPPEPLASPENVHMHIFSHTPREHGVTLPALLRQGSFTEVNLGLIDEPGREPAVAEAQRCFSCGVCNQCDRCVDFCPDGVCVRDGDGYRFDYDYCKGCGVCSSQCPRGVIYMAEL